MSSPPVPSYPVPPNEEERLSALRACNILDSAPEPAFDRIVGLAARIFHTPMALIGLVDAERQWYKARCGLDATETSRASTFCAYTMLEPGPTVICDATLDPRFCHYPAVKAENGVRFYAGAPILTRDGLALGTLCVTDSVARPSPPQELVDVLVDLAFLAAERMHVLTEAHSAAEYRYLAQLERARRAAESANKAKSDFLARMSHEIRTPMNLIMGMNELLLESSLTTLQREYLTISHRNQRRLLRLINGILDLSKVEAGELVFQSVPFDLEEFLSECAATISPAIERKVLELEIRTDPGVWRFWLGDPERLQQVLLNLIANSIKFTTEGKICVRVFPETSAPTAKGADARSLGGVPDAAAVLPEFPGQPGLRFEVEDTGCGVPNDKAAILFEPFQQAAEYMSRPHEGTGLGLAIARTLVERMGGKIWFAEKTTPGAKVIFTVFLPRATQPAISGRLAEVVPQLPPGQFSGARVLLVEDNSDNVILMQAYLESCSLALHLASNGLQAVEKRQCHDYDLVLMDIQLPIMDGYAATRAIRDWEQSRDLQRVPILALTAHAFSGAAADSLQAGCDGHLTKPVERNELFEAMAKVMRPRQPARQTAGVVSQPARADLLPAERSDAERSDADLSDAIKAQQPVFLSRRRADILKLREALAIPDFAAMQNIGHNCKGTGTGYGFPGISRLGLALEQAAKACDVTLLATFIDRFERSVEAACQSIL